MTRAPVLAGGGVAGLAGQPGVLDGPAGSGIDVADADPVIGTSAGSAPTPWPARRPAPAAGPAARW